MGLYDEVRANIRCPICGRLLSNFQTKELDPCMAVYNIEDIVKTTLEKIHVYAYCYHKVKKGEDYDEFVNAGVGGCLYAYECGDVVEITITIPLTPVDKEHKMICPDKTKWEIHVIPQDYNINVLACNKVDLEEWNEHTLKAMYGDDKSIDKRGDKEC